MTTQSLARPQTQTPAEVQRQLGEGLFNRYLLPRVALTVIAIGSLAGVYLTMSTHGAAPVWALVRWLHLIGLGALAGGAMWWGLFQRRPEQAADVAAVGRFAMAQQQRFRIIGGAALLAATLTAPYLIWFGRWAGQTGQQGLWIASAVALIAALALSGWMLWQPPAQERAFAVGRVRLALGALVLALTLTALLDARLSFSSAVNSRGCPAGLVESSIDRRGDLCYALPRSPQPSRSSHTAQGARAASSSTERRRAVVQPQTPDA